MTFASPIFLLFLVGAWSCYGIAPRKLRWLVLLAASYGFYALWDWRALWVLALVTLGSYLSARQMQMRSAPSARKRWFAFGVLVVLGSLLAFKYFNYGMVVFDTLFGLGDLPLISMAAPLGISFFSLQVYAYLMDVYRGQMQAETHLGKYALFVTFFPQLVAGPITRAKQLLPQIHQPQTLIPDHFYTGVARILWGGVQKFVIADRLSALISPVFDDPQPYRSLALAAAIYLYALQIYMDFAGYSNMAIGLGRLFGLKLAENFDLPYLAKDITEFWNRWHISLTHWLRDYIFYPAMRLLRKWVKRPASLVGVFVPPLLTMLVSGIWHGPGTHFLVWGLYHGVLLGLSAATARWRKRVSMGLPLFWRGTFSAFQVLLTFHLVLLGWVFFRLPTVGMGMAFLGQMFAGAAGTALVSGVSTAALVGILLLLFGLMEGVQIAGAGFDPLPKLPAWAWWLLAYALVFLLLFMGNFDGSQPFIYERF